MKESYTENNKYLKKPIIAMDVNSSKRGGPYVATKNIMDSFLKDEFEFHEIIYNNSLGRFISWKRIKNLKNQIQQIRPDSIIINGLQLSCFHVCVAAWLSGVKSRIVTIHGSSTEAIGLPWYILKLLYIIEFLSLALCTSFYGVSKYASSISATKWFRNKNKGYVYNVAAPITHLDKKSRSQLGIKDTDIIVSSSGRIIKDKGYEYLAKAIKDIHNQNIKFIIIGDGNYLEELRNFLTKEIDTGRVILTGFTENVYEYLNISDIFILPTLHETLSVSLLEASAMSLPLISCNVGGVPEVVNETNGILIPPGDTVAIKEAIEMLAENAMMRQQMGENSLKHLKRTFDNKKSLAVLRDIIKTDIYK